jgi:hypothetical protein
MIRNRRSYETETVTGLPVICSDESRTTEHTLPPREKTPLHNNYMTKHTTNCRVIWYYRFCTSSTGLPVDTYRTSVTTVTIDLELRRVASAFPHAASMRVLSGAHRAIVRKQEHSHVLVPDYMNNAPLSQVLRSSHIVSPSD